MIANTVGQLKQKNKDYFIDKNLDTRSIKSNKKIFLSSKFQT